MKNKLKVLVFIIMLANIFFLFTEIGIMATLSIILLIGSSYALRTDIDEIFDSK